MPPSSHTKSLRPSWTYATRQTPLAVADLCLRHVEGAPLTFIYCARRTLNPVADALAPHFAPTGLPFSPVKAKSAKAKGHQQKAADRAARDNRTVRRTSADNTVDDALGRLYRRGREGGILLQQALHEWSLDSHASPSPSCPQDADASDIDDDLLHEGGTSDLYVNKYDTFCTDSDDEPDPDWD